MLMILMRFVMTETMLVEMGALKVASSLNVLTSVFKLELVSSTAAMASSRALILELAWLIQPLTSNAMMGTY